MTVENRVPRTAPPSPATDQPGAEPPVDFEQSLAELEALVERLEHGDLPLDDALKSFERGVALTRQCQSALKAAQQKVEILLKNSVSADPEPFSDGSEPALASAE
jgi:exodeoxyribonuclease VII small subunit